MAVAPKPQAAEVSLRRSVTPWGSFSWGYSDVGADIFVGLGLVLGAGVCLLTYFGLMRIPPRALFATTTTLITLLARPPRR